MSRKHRPQQGTEGFVQDLTASGIDCSAWANRNQVAFTDAHTHMWNNVNADWPTGTSSYPALKRDPYTWTVGNNHSQLSHFVTSPRHKEPKVQVNGKQFIVVSNGFVEYADTRDAANAAAERLAHANQADAYILAPIAKTAPKRDVVTTEIAL